MKLIIGLGNIGKNYDGTFHNIGFFVIDKLSSEFNINHFKTKRYSLFAKGLIDNNEIILAKPTTYMNLSGKSVIEMQKFFKVENKDTLIILDDIDLPKGKIRYRDSGSAGTHNGLRDIVFYTGEDIPRLRIGIGKDENKDLADYVLSKISAEDMKEITPAVDLAMQKIIEFVGK